MYSREVWDYVYKKHKKDAPWLSDACCDIYSAAINPYLPKEINGLYMLDYGCGNGKIAARLRNKGAKIDLAEISHRMIKFLNRHYYSCNIFEVDIPQRIGKANSYDFIITWMLFCNIQSDFWTGFLNGFYELLKPGGNLLIGGWDKDDPINIKNHNIVVFTEREMWPINDLLTKLDQSKFKILANDKLLIKLPFYNDNRAVRCFKLEKI